MPTPISDSQLFTYTVSVVGANSPQITTRHWRLALRDFLQAFHWHRLAIFSRH